MSLGDEFRLIDTNASAQDKSVYSLVQKYIDLNRQIKEFKKIMMKIQVPMMEF